MLATYVNFSMCSQFEDFKAYFPSQNVCLQALCGHAPKMKTICAGTYSPFFHASGIFFRGLNKKILTKTT